MEHKSGGGGAGGNGLIRIFAAVTTREETHGSFDVIISGHGQFVAKPFGQHTKSLFRSVVYLVARIDRIRMSRYTETSTACKRIITIPVQNNFVPNGNVGSLIIV